MKNSNSLAKKKKLKTKDERITKPLLTWKVIFIIMTVIYFLIVGQYFVLLNNQDKLGNVLSMLAFYLGFTCIFVGVLYVMFLWLFNVRVLRKISDGARRVAGGDFDVTIENVSKKGSKNEIDILIDDFNTMARELKGNEMLKSDFIANVSHEIKTPLCIIQTYTKALKEENLPKEKRDEYIDTIINTSQSLSVMIANILKLNKLENQKIPPAKEPLQMGEFLRGLAIGYMDTWLNKEIDFSIDVVDVVAYYDQSILELIFNNLLSNAIKFTNNGGSISLTSTKQDGYLYVKVTDNGIGMDQETLSKIFEKFYQGDTSHYSEGNGLGLAIVKKATDLIGGEITVKSKPNKGTTFTVKLKI